MSSNVLFLISVLIVLCFDNCALCSTFEYNKNDVAQPIDYQIKIVSFLEKNSSYEGHVEILTKFSNAIDTIKLNVNDKIYIKRTQVFKRYENVADDIWEKLQLIRHQTIPSNELYVLQFTEKLFKNTVYKIIIDFCGYLSNDTNGFFVVNSNSDNRWASTNLRRNGAKQLFPCFDLPNRLTDFTLELVHHKQYNSTFITDEEYRIDCKEIHNYICVKFKKVSFIAPYMLRFLIGSFHTEIMDSAMFLMPKNIVNRTTHQLNEHTKYLKFIAHEIKITLNLIKKYFVPKYLNMKILLLEEFQYSDSWGFITLQKYPVQNIWMESRKFREYKIVKQLRFQLARETFEQHFYPYRINPMCDGFAKLIEYTTVLLHRKIGDDKCIPCTMRGLFVTDIQDAMLQETLLIQNENIQIGTNWNTMINKFNFDDTKYNIVRHIMTIKRGVIFMMFEDILKKRFQSNFDSFVNPHAFERLTTITRTEKLIPIHIGNIIHIFLTWDTVGFPVINLEPERITQHRFRYDGISEFSNILIPISYALKLNVSENEKHIKWFTSETEDIKTNDWLLVNLHSHGYYRVNYNESHWMYLTKKLHENSTIMEPVQRTKLIDDAFQLARAGKINYDIPLNLATYLINEISYGPWKAAINNFNFIESLLETESEFNLFTAYLKVLLQNNIEIKQWLSKHTFQNNEVFLYEIICRFKVYDCVEDLNNYMLSPDELHLQNIKLCTYYKSQLHNIEEYDNYWKRTIAYTTDLKLIEYLIEPLVCIIDFKYPHTNKEYYRTYVKHFRDNLEKAKPYQEIFLAATLKYQGRTIFGRLMILDMFRNYYSNIIHKSKYFDDKAVQLLTKVLLRMTNDNELNMFDYIYYHFRHNFTDEQKMFLNKTKNTAKINVQTLRGKKEAIILWLQK